MSYTAPTRYTRPTFCNLELSDDVNTPSSRTSYSSEHLVLEDRRWERRYPAVPLLRLTRRVGDVERGGAAAGAGGGADAACGQEQGGLLRCEPRRQARPDQALPGAGEARWPAGDPWHLRHRRGGGAVRRAVARGAGGGGEGCSGADERGGAAGAGGGADAARGRQQDGLLRCAPRQARPAQALPGAGEARWQQGEPGPLRHRRRDGAVRRAHAGGAGGGAKGCSRAGAADERGGAAAGAGGRADAARGREQDGLLRREPPAWQVHDQALSRAGEARWQGCEPGLLRHRRGGGAVRRAVAGGAGGGGGGGEAGCSGAAADERGGTAAGAGGGADAARGRQQDGLLQREPHQSWQAQALYGAGVARWQDGAPRQLRHRRGGGAVRRAGARGAGGGGADGSSTGGNATVANGRGSGAAGCALRPAQGGGGGGGGG
eukprot:scaffold49953_cov55-Phaeocystis_antarctica.AAC.2